MIFFTPNHGPQNGCLSEQAANETTCPPIISGQFQGIVFSSKRRLGDQVATDSGPE